jgi:hypothetical protein
MAAVSAWACEPAAARRASTPPRAQAASIAGDGEDEERERAMLEWGGEDSEGDCDEGGRTEAAQGHQGHR